MSTFTVSISPRDAADIIQQYVVNEGMSTTCVGSYSSTSPEGKEVIMLVFEKYFMRNSSRASLSVVVENLKGRTSVASVGSGGGQGALFGFDWGAGDSFSSLVEKSLRPYMV